MSDEKQRLLMIFAHPDDEVHAAGTAAKYAKAGHSVTIIWLTRGDMGHMTMPSEELGKVRSQEAEAAAKTMGADFRIMDYGDSNVPYDRETTLMVVDLIREFKPNLIITWGGVDRHPDHRNTHNNIVDAVHLAALPLLKTKFPACDPGALYFINESQEAEVFVDITETYEIKREVAKCHKSQYEGWLTEHQSGTDKGYASTTEGLLNELVHDPSRAHGLRTGVKYAEGFTPYVRPRPKALDLLPLDYSR